MNRRGFPVKSIFLSWIVIASTASAQSASPPKTSLAEEVNSVYPQVQTLYMDLHEHPELSLKEVKTAAKLAARLGELGYEVTEKVGGTGVVGILRNGAGQTVMLRTELDALPVEEKTGLPYASTVHTKDDAGHDVPVMHACGHDVHMAAWVGTATIMAQTKKDWHGTLVLVAQPAEERGMGAKNMVTDGLFTRFPKPDVGIALHTGNTLPAGKVGFTPEYAASNADTVNITIYGKGGHGASPDTTVDPIVIAARVILGLQTIVSREIKPGQPAVITVGYIQGGTKQNIIPDQVQLGLTVRSYTPEVRKHLLSGIERVAKAEAEAAAAPKPPLVQVVESADALYNDPKLAERMTQVLIQALGADNVVKEPPIMASEDYSVFVEAGVPSFYFWLGVADPVKFKEAQASGVQLPSNHSPFFAPDMEPSLKTAVEAEVAVLQNLLGKGGSIGAGVE
jgi:amidohydrolase